MHNSRPVPWDEAFRWGDLQGFSGLSILSNSDRTVLIHDLTILADNIVVWNIPCKFRLYSALVRGVMLLSEINLKGWLHSIAATKT